MDWMAARGFILNYLTSKHRPIFPSRNVTTGRSSHYSSLLQLLTLSSRSWSEPRHPSGKIPISPGFEPGSPRMLPLKKGDYRFNKEINGVKSTYPHEHLSPIRFAKNIFDGKLSIKKKLSLIKLASIEKVNENTGFDFI